MSAPVDVLAVMDRDALHAQAYRIAYGVIDSTAKELAQEYEDARSAVVALMEAHQELLRTAKIGSLYVSGEGSDEESENLESAIRDGDAALARCGGTK